MALELLEDRLAPTTGFAAPLPADVDGNGQVDVVDQLLTRLRVGQNAGDPGYSGQFDVDSNGAINSVDVLLGRHRVGTVAEAASLPAEAAAATIDAVEAQSKVILPDSRVLDEVAGLLVSFSQEMNAASVEAVTNWDLLKDGVPVTNPFNSVTYTSNGVDTFEATLTFRTALGNGRYVLMARDMIRSFGGMPLDGDGNGMPGGLFVLPFVVGIPDPAGPIFLAAPPAGGSIFDPTIAIHADGNFTIAFAAANGLTDGVDVFGQRFDSNGVPIGTKFPVNDPLTSVTNGNQDRPSIAIDNATGEFVVAWRTDHGGDHDVSAHRFNPDGTTIGTEQRVNEFLTDDQRHQKLDMLPDGGFVIVWESIEQDDTGDTGGVYARVFPRSAIASAEFRVNTTITDTQAYPDVATDANGNFVVAWQSDQEGDWDIFAQRYNALGMPLGGEFPVSPMDSSFTVREEKAAVAMANDGSFVIAWLNHDSNSVFAQRYAANGDAVGTPLILVPNAVTPPFGNIFGLSVDADDDGDFVVTYQTSESLGPGQFVTDIHGVVFNSSGVQVSENFRLAEPGANPNGPASAMDADGDWVGVWYEYDQDLGGFLHAQRFFAPVPDVAEPNNSTVDATELGMVAGEQFLPGLSIHNETDTDWFKFTLTEPATEGHFVSINFVDRQGDLTIELLDRDSRVVRSSVSRGDNEQVSLAGLSAGTYFLRVFGRGSSSSFAGGGLQDEAGLVARPLPHLGDEPPNVNPNYILNLMTPAPPAADFAEPNDDEESATLLGVAADRLSVTSLSVDSATDEDWYSFFVLDTPGVGDFLRIQFTHAQGDLAVELYDPTGLVRLDTHADTAGNTEQISLTTLTQPLSAGQPYFIRVFGVNGATNPTYSLTLQVPTADPGADFYDQFLPDNAPENSSYAGTAVGELVHANRTIHTPVDVDYIGFATISVGTGAHSIEAVFNRSNGELEFELYSYDFFEMGLTLLGSSTPSSLGARISLEGLPAGNYMVRVAGVGGDINYYSLVFDAPHSAEDPLDDWTILVYMTAGDLAGRAKNDLEEMELALATIPGTVNIGVYWDQSQANPFATGGGEQQAWGTAGRAFLDADNELTSLASSFEILAEENSATGASFEQFVRWGVEARPANNYALILWDHGLGIWGSNFDDHDPDPIVGPADRLTLSELDAALTALEQDDIAFGLIAYDASLMGMAEVVHSLGGHTPIVVASEQVGESSGFDYDSALAILEDQPFSVTPLGLADAIVRSYKDRYNGHSTLTAFDTSDIAALSASLANFTAVVTADATPTDFEHIDDARSGAPAFVDPSFRDLGSFLAVVANNELVSQTVRTAAAGAHTALRDAVIAEAANPLAFSGLSIYFPDDLNALDAVDYFALFEDFDQATQWFNFLEEFTGAAGSRAGTYSPDRFETPERNDVQSLSHRFFTLAGSNTFDSLTLDRLSDVDWYRFSIAATGEAGNQLRITHDHQIDGAAGSIQFTLFEDDGQGDQIGAPVATVTGVGTMSLQNLPAANYLVRVNAAGVVPRYALRVDAPDTPPSSDWAGDNSTLDKAFDLTGLVSQPIFTGLVLGPNPNSPAPILDWFTFEGPAVLNPPATRMTIRAVGNPALQVRLLDVTSNVVSAAAGTGQVAVQATLTPSAEYFLEVSTTQNAALAYSVEFGPGITTSDAPTVVGVSIFGSQWGQNNPPFDIPVGTTDQLDPLAWTNVDQVRIAFSKDVVVTQGDLIFTSSFGPVATTGFQYDGNQFIATWQVTSGLLLGRYTLELSDNVQDAMGRALDGEWTNGSDAYPSGNGVIGGDFVFQFNVLPADADSNERVDVFDVLFTRLRVGQSFDQNGYDARFDLNADGVVNVFDVLFGRLRVGTQLPP